MTIVDFGLLAFLLHGPPWLELLEGHCSHRRKCEFPIAVNVQKADTAFQVNVLYLHSM